ncbi:DUF4097 family beta strand repeat-containing protein [Nocardiopsis baichengensis]|uniref:DUF4097 family beta strand repeat-containing protein n=1 Tax=Nocardiopsis baichengensis TaxID=280240 RepID=UPI0003494B1F|nr:DUF4097 family beta strand repeat-containing protein [Nocardiopsis baichengensis]
MTDHRHHRHHRNHSEETAVTTFDTPGPITADIDVVAGGLQITASDRADTAVSVRPLDPGKDADVRAADQVQVDCSGGRLTVATQKSGLGRMLQKGMVEITVELPADSHLQVRADFVNVRGEGRLGGARVRLSTGNVLLDRLAGKAEITTGTGRIRVQEMDGTAALKTTTGTITVGTATGSLHMASATGDLTADRVLDSVEAKAAHGNILLGEAVRGRVDLRSSYGELEVGIRSGTAAWIDAASEHGTVRSSLEEADGPESSEDTVEVHARARFGDVVVRRA